jgi:hypothetical protein
MTSDHTRWRRPAGVECGDAPSEIRQTGGETMGWISPLSIGSGEAEHREQRRVHTPPFFGRQVADQTPEPSHVDRSDLFDEHSGGRRIDLDLGPK